MIERLKVLIQKLFGRPTVQPIPIEAKPKHLRLITNDCEVIDLQAAAKHIAEKYYSDEEGPDAS